MKKCLLFIEKCFDCPYCHQLPHTDIGDVDFAYGDFICTKTGKEINIDGVIPDWCLLEDVLTKKPICPMCFEEEIGDNTDGLCIGCFKANKEDNVIDDKILEQIDNIEECF